MTVARAIKICDHLIGYHLKNSKGLRRLVKDWESDSPKKMAITIAEVHEDVAKCILLIKQNIKPICKHPKKMQDGIKGHRYCMKCNLDLD